MSGKSTKIKVAKISVSLDFESIQDRVANQCASKIRMNSPKNRPKYRNGWTTSTQGSSKSRKVIVHNNAMPMTTHLLENGHLTRKKKGGKGKSRVAPIPHIRPAVNEFVGKYVNEMKKAKIVVKSDLKGG